MIKKYFFTTYWKAGDVRNRQYLNNVLYNDLISFNKEIDETKKNNKNSNVINIKNNKNNLKTIDLLKSIEE